MILEVIYDCWVSGYIEIRTCLPSYSQIKTMTFKTMLLWCFLEEKFTSLHWPGKVQNNCFIEAVINISLQVVPRIHRRSPNIWVYEIYLYLASVQFFSVIILAKTEKPDPDNFLLYHTIQKCSKIQTVILCGALTGAKPYAVLVWNNYKSLNI